MVDNPPGLSVNNANHEQKCAISGEFIISENEICIELSNGKTAIFISIQSLRFLIGELEKLNKLPKGIEFINAGAENESFTTFSYAKEEDIDYKKNKKCPICKDNYYGKFVVAFPDNKQIDVRSVCVHYDCIEQLITELKSYYNSSIFQEML